MPTAIVVQWPESMHNNNGKGIKGNSWAWPVKEMEVIQFQSSCYVVMLSQWDEANCRLNQGLIEIVMAKYGYHIALSSM